MFEVIAAIAYTALYAALVGVLLGFSPARRSTKIAVAAAAALWGVIVVTIAGFGLGATGAAGGCPDSRGGVRSILCPPVRRVGCTPAISGRAALRATSGARRPERRSSSGRLDGDLGRAGADFLAVRAGRRMG
jgi:hypothetical protein